jgi:hypothetical protein
MHASHIVSSLLGLVIGAGAWIYASLLVVALVWETRVTLRDPRYMRPEGVLARRLPLQGRWPRLALTASTGLIAAGMAVHLKLPDYDAWILPEAALASAAYHLLALCKHLGRSDIVETTSVILPVSARRKIADSVLLASALCASVSLLGCTGPFAVAAAWGLVTALMEAWSQVGGG